MLCFKKNIAVIAEKNCWGHFYFALSVFHILSIICIKFPEKLEGINEQNKHLDPTYAKDSATALYSRPSNMITDVSQNILHGKLN